jgi:hypothetical protein
VLLPVGLEDLGNFWYQRIIGVGVVEQRTNREENFLNSEGRAPLIFQNIQTNSARIVDVAVVDACGESNFRRLERVVSCQGKEKKRNDMD